VIGSGEQLYVLLNVIINKNVFMFHKFAIFLKIVIVTRFKAIAMKKVIVCLFDEYLEILK